MLGQCAVRGIPRHVSTLSVASRFGSEQRSVMVMEKLPGERLSDVNRAELDLRRVLGEVGDG